MNLYVLKIELYLPKGDNFKTNFISLFFGCAGSSLPCGFFSGCITQVYSQVVVHGLLITVAALAAEHRLQSAWASVAAVRRLSSCGSRALEQQTQ